MSAILNTKNQTSFQCVPSFIHLTTSVTLCFFVPAFYKTGEFIELIELNDVIVINDAVRRKCKLLVEWSSVLIPQVAKRGLCLRRVRNVT